MKNNHTSQCHCSSFIQCRLTETLAWWWNVELCRNLFANYPTRVSSHERPAVVTPKSYHCLPHLTMNNDSEFVVLKEENHPEWSLLDIRNFVFVPQVRPWQEGKVAIPKQPASHTDHNFCTDLVYVRSRMYPNSSPVITLVWEMVKRFTKAKKVERMDVCGDFKWLYSNHFI